MSFEVVCQAWYGVSHGNKDYREACKRYLGPLLDSFAASEGSLLESYFCEDVVGGCALTRTTKPDPQYTLHTVYGIATAATAPAAALIPRCERMCVDASTFLTEPSRGRHADQVYSVSTYLLGLVNDLAMPGKITQDKAEAALALQQEELDRTGRELERLAQRDAQIVYFGGMIMGLLMTAVLAALATWILHGIDVSDQSRDEVMGAFSGGAIGAFVSVLTRMTASSLRLNYRTGRFYLRLLGAFRPVIGAVLALALTFLILAGVLDVFKVPDSDGGKFFFFAGIGFLAGFSERWAQDMLVIPQRAAVPEGAPAAPAGAARPVTPTPAGASAPAQALPRAVDPASGE